MRHDFRKDPNTRGSVVWFCCFYMSKFIIHCTISFHSCWYVLNTSYFLTSLSIYLTGSSSRNPCPVGQETANLRPWLRKNVIERAVCIFTRPIRKSFKQFASSVTPSWTTSNVLWLIVYLYSFTMAQNASWKRQWPYMSCTMFSLLFYGLLCFFNFSKRSLCVICDFL